MSSSKPSSVGAPWVDLVSPKFRDVVWYSHTLFDFGFNSALLLERCHVHLDHDRSRNKWVVRLLGAWELCEARLATNVKDQYQLLFRYALLGGHLSCHIGEVDDSELDDDDYTEVVVGLTGDMETDALDEFDRGRLLQQIEAALSRRSRACFHPSRFV